MVVPLSEMGKTRRQKLSVGTSRENSDGREPAAGLDPSLSCHLTVRVKTSSGHLVLGSECPCPPHIHGLKS